MRVSEKIIGDHSVGDMTCTTTAAAGHELNIMRSICHQLQPFAGD